MSSPHPQPTLTDLAAGAEQGRLAYNLLRFGQLLRGLGFGVTPARQELLLAALGHVDLSRRPDVQQAARAVLVSRREQLPLFDQAFELFWRSVLAGTPLQDLGQPLQPKQRPRQRQALGNLPAPPAGDDGAEPLDTVLQPELTYSARELLRHKDFAQLTPDEEREVRALLRRQVLHLAPRLSRRRTPHPRGRWPDLRRTLRHSFHNGGEPLVLARRRRKPKRRPLVVLCDVSGSMEPYARMLLLFLYTLRTATDRLEAFAFGTRLTRISRQLDQRDVQLALTQATAAVCDWGGGTRIGEALEAFNRGWARRVLGQGAVLLLISDGWDRGDPGHLGRQMERLQASCSRLIWLNPLLGMPGYQPLTRGLRAALPHVDDFLPVHNLKSLEQLVGLLARLEA